MLRALLFLGLSIVPLAAQQQPATKTQTISIDAVIDMVQAGIAEDVIVTMLRKLNKPLDLTPADLIRLKKARVSDNVLKAMLDPKSEIKPSTGTGQPTPSMTSGPPQTPIGPKLAAANVQPAVDQAIDWTRKAGSVIVTGVQELPGQNEARADLQFNDFQYNANGFNHMPKPKNEVTPPEPRTNSPTFYAEMANIPARERHVARYAGGGSATIKHYSDGRWVLTQIDFNFLQITTTIPISLQADSRQSEMERPTSPMLPTPAGVSLPSGDEAAVKRPSAKPETMWDGTLTDAQGSYYIQLMLTDGGSDVWTGQGRLYLGKKGPGGLTGIVVSAVIKHIEDSGTVALSYHYPERTRTCSATLKVKGTWSVRGKFVLIRGDTINGSTCSTITQTGTLSLMKH